MAIASNDELLTPAEVAELFRVDPKTVTRWANAGKISAFKTLGGHRRYRAAQIHALFDVSEWTETHGGAVDIRNQVGD